MPKYKVEQDRFKAIKIKTFLALSPNVKLDKPFYKLNEEQTRRNN